MEDELLVDPTNFSQPREFDLLQDDFLDIAEDSHHGDMAMCLANGSAHSGQIAQDSEDKCSAVSSASSISCVDDGVNLLNGGHADNQAMKLDNLDTWDQDVLLSNAGLPETNPLLLDGDLDSSMGEDFQKMLNEWENHIGTLQTSEMPDVDMNSLVPSEVAPTSNTSVTAVPSSAMPSSTLSVIKTEPKHEQLSTIRDETAGGQTKMTLGQMTLAGIVISSGPGDHFETYEVLEATDAENLLEQFEEASSDYEAGSDLDEASPKKTSNIFKAVQNHFAAAAAAAAASGDPTKYANVRRHPRIVPSQRIRDALPKEIIERIKASSQKSRTIAIIEPVHKNGGDSSRVNESSNSKENGCSSAVNSSTVASISTKPSIISKSHVVQPQHHTRFQEAANSLNKTKHLRLITTTSNPQQVQISLDHDYCSSSAKLKRGQQRLNNVITTAAASSLSTSRPLIRVQPALSSASSSLVVTKPSSIVVSSPMSSRSIVRVHSEVAVPMPIAVEVSSSSSSSSNNIVVSSPLSSPARKDSGLESGDASDTSDSLHATSSMTSGSNSDLYSKVPPYLTTINVSNSDSRSISTEEEVKSYDRLPAYVKGVPKRVAAIVKTSSARLASSNVEIAEQPSGSEGRMRTRQACRSRSSSSNSSGDHSSTEVSVKPDLNISHRMATRSLTSASSMMASPPLPSPMRRRRQSSTSSSDSRPDLRSPRQKKRRSWRKPSLQDRSRSPLDSRLPQPSQQRPVEERRVIYVGQIAEGTTRADLRKRFETFGPIEEISVHFRDRGDNYGFITFCNKKDAFSAIEHGNDDPSYPKVDLCFGGRRTFCKEKYADLDSGFDSRRRRPYGHCGNDFDSLLQQARAGIQK